MAEREWLFRRNCSITPRQLGLFFIGLSCVSVSIALYFALHGAWFVMVFAVLELAVVAGALLVYARHANDSEHIALGMNALVVDLMDGARVTQVCFDTRIAQVKAPSSRNGLIELHGPDRHAAIGRYLPESRRRDFARELALEMQRLTRCGDPTEF